MRSIFRNRNPQRTHSFGINHLLQPPGGRDLAEYERVLGFNKDELEGKKVLDLGAGPQVKFAAQLAAAGIGAAVVSLSPDFTDKQVVKKVPAAHRGNLVAGFGQNLPFANDSFDVVVAFHVQEHLRPDDFVATAKEIGRVLAVGGWARFGPLTGIGDSDPYAVLSNSRGMEELTGGGVRLRQEFVPLDVLPLARLQDYLGLTYCIQGYNLIFERS